MHPHGQGTQQKIALPGIRQVIAVASGKGGVG
jgi:Mrp family chromosome partitioning ATPase